MTPPGANFTLFDWFLALVLAFSVFSAFSRGLIRVLASLAGLVVGILAASWNFLRVAARLHHWISSFALCELLGFVAILVLVMAIFTWIAIVLSKTVKAIGLGFVDRLLGAAFGLVRGALLGVAAIMAATAFFPELDAVRHSVLTPYFLTGVDGLSFVVPRHFQIQIEAGAKHLLHVAPGFFRLQH